MPARGAPRVEQEIVEIPENEVGIAFGRPQVAVVVGIDLEQDLAVHQQGEQLDPGKAFLAAEPSDLLRRGQQGESGRDLRIADPKQRSGARRFQHHRVAAPPQIGKARQGENLGISERRRLRPIVRDLRFDDDSVRVARRPDGIFQETVPGQSPRQGLDLAIDGPRRGSQRGEPQACLQRQHALRRCGAERSEVERIAVEVSEDVSVGARFELGVGDSAGQKQSAARLRRARVAAGARKVTLRCEGGSD